VSKADLHRRFRPEECALHKPVHRSRRRIPLVSLTLVVTDAADKVKNRIDGNPASRPGPDPTDRRI